MAIGNDELQDKPVVHEGDKIICPHCRKIHPLECALQNGVKTEIMMFYSCRKKSYLAAIENKLLGGLKKG
jgi:hypothetical protein